MVRYVAGTTYETPALVAANRHVYMGPAPFPSCTPLIVTREPPAKGDDCGLTTETCGAIRGSVAVSEVTWAPPSSVTCTATFEDDVTAGEVQ